jgi:hypothetical protein
MRQALSLRLGPRTVLAGAFLHEGSASAGFGTEGGESGSCGEAAPFFARLEPLQSELVLQEVFEHFLAVAVSFHGASPFWEVDPLT